MARSYRRRQYKRRSYGRKRYSVKRRSYRKYGRKPYRRGNQRIVKKRYPVNNPFGDKVQVKFRFSIGGRFNPLSSVTAVDVSGPFNDLNAAETQWTTCPGFDVYPKQFKNYRVTGVKVRFTPKILDTSTGASYMGFILGSDTGYLGIAYNTLPEQRWVRYKPLNNYLSGGSTKSLSLYLSTLKVGGADRTIAIDEDYTSTTNTSAPYYNSVPKQLVMQFGILSDNSTQFDGHVCNYTAQLTYYVTFWGKRINS